jgi:tetratricopeptide (TPR) repeat protein
VLASLVGCSRQSSLSGETVVFDETVTLIRGKAIDTFDREFLAPVDGTCVAFVEENDADMVLELAVLDGPAPRKTDVESGLYGSGLEIAALPVTRGSKLSIRLSMPPDMPKPARAPTRLTCYDVTAQALQPRVTAYRAISEAMQRGSDSEEMNKRRRELIDVAVANLEGPGGDARMAAWAHVFKGNQDSTSIEDMRISLNEFRAAEKAFASLKEPDARNAARARFRTAIVLAAIITDAKWTDPTPEEAKAQAIKVFTELTTDPALSEVERARAINFLGVICFQVADYACATRHFEAAADASHKAGHRRDELTTLHNLGVTALDLGNYAESVRYFDRVIPLVSREYAPNEFVTYRFNAGVAYANFGDTTRAIENLLEALQAARERESATDMGRVMYGLGLTYWRRGDILQAGTFFAESLQQRRKTADAIGIIMSLAMVGRFARYEGRPQEALAMHREALERSSTTDLKLRSKYELAFDYAAAKDYANAIAQCRSALKETGGIHPIRRAQMHVALAQFLIDGKPDAEALAEAEDLAQGALRLALEKSDAVLEMSARHLLAKARAARGKSAEARREYETAIAVILDFRGTTASPELQAATVAHEQETFREYVDLLMREAVKRGAGAFAAATPDEEAALRVLELARSSTSAPVRDTTLDAASQARIDTLLQQMAAKRVRIMALNNAAPDGKMAQLVQLEMSALRAEVDRLRGGDVDDRRPIQLPGSVSRPWPAIGPGVTQLSYAVGARNAYLWTRDARGLRVAVLSGKPADLDRAFAAYAGISAVRSPGSLEKALADFSALLLPPGTFDPASDSLEIVADGTLGTLPFAALRDPASGKRVVETHAVRLITSMFDTGTGAAARPRRLAFVGVASGTGKIRSAGHEFPQLGSARAEARAIADLFTGGAHQGEVKLLSAADGDAETIRALWSGGADAVHFATHGLANLRFPSASLLLLPKGGGAEPAYLTAGQVQEWRGDAGLVFLAACETAAGAARFAEGMSGLPRSFLGAGARGIVGTLWPVEDVYESQFSIEFYRRFIVGRDAEAALAQTQREWLKPRAGEKASDHQQRLATAWAHVFYAKPKSR